MVIYVICGKPDCTQFAHAIYVVEYLSRCLPNFRYRKIEKSKAEWPDFVAQLNERNNWYMVRSPIIWREISTWGSKPFLIGDLSEFWQHCYCYYGLESSISRDQLEKLAYRNLTDHIYESSSQHPKYNVVISILCTGETYLIQHLLEEIVKLPFSNTSNGVFIKIYRRDLETAEQENLKRSLKDIEEYFNSQALFGQRPVVEIVKSEYDAIENCDLLIFMEDFSRIENEDQEIWLKRCLAEVTMLADVVNVRAKREMRIIFCNEGPVCFMATLMVRYCTVLIPSNIVALTADRGLSVIRTVSDITGLPVSKMGAPPVWGFVGLNEYVDESNIVLKEQVLKPYKRAFTSPDDSLLPLGTVVTELRLMTYLLPKQHEEIVQKVRKKKEAIIARLHRNPILSKLVAMKSLLKIWYAQQPSDQIISLGVCSNGFYGIPPGLVFSQPCIQDKKRRWRPFPKFPLINQDTLSKLKELLEDTTSIIQRAGLSINVSDSSI